MELRRELSTVESFCKIIFLIYFHKALFKIWKVTLSLLAETTLWMLPSSVLGNVPLHRWWIISWKELPCPLFLAIPGCNLWSSPFTSFFFGHLWSGCWGTNPSYRVYSWLSFHSAHDGWVWNSVRQLLNIATQFIWQYIFSQNIIYFLPISFQQVSCARDLFENIIFMYVGCAFWS